MEDKSAVIYRAHKPKPQRVYSRTIADHKDRMAVRRAEQLIRKVTRPFVDRGKFTGQQIRAWAGKRPA